MLLSATQALLGDCAVGVDSHCLDRGFSISNRYVRSDEEVHGIVINLLAVGRSRVYDSCCLVARSPSKDMFALGGLKGLKHLRDFACGGCLHC